MEKEMYAFVVPCSARLARDTWERFCSNKRAVVGLVLLVLISLIALVGPIISPYPYDGMDTSVANQGSSLAHWFGTDRMGRDEFTRVLYGARISLMIGFVATVANMVIGIIYGGIAGYIGGLLDNLMVRIMDIIQSIPAMIYMILIMLMLGSNVYSVMIGICVNGWINMARIVRGEVKSLKEREFARHREPLHYIPGTPPNLLYRSNGCTFCSRCDRAMKICKEYRPAETVFSEEHGTKCWLYCRQFIKCIPKRSVWRLYSS